MAQPNGYYNYKGQRKDVLVKTAAYTVEEHLYECGNFSNRGATGAVTITLPLALPGRTHTLYVEAAQDFAAVPQTGEYLALSSGAFNTVSIGVDCATDGASITWECIETGSWSLVKAVGTWATV